MQKEERQTQIAVIGLGYVGLPLAVLFSKHFAVIGYDYVEERINEISKDIDRTGEVTKEALFEAQELYRSSEGRLGCKVTADATALKSCNIYIIAVPTPVDENHLPDLHPLQEATRLVAGYLKKGDLVIYESTVFPGCTEEVAIPILESISALELNTDFGVGYSPERVNPGDTQRKLPDIKKVTSGSNVMVAKQVDQLYATIITAGTCLVSSIKIAEAAKVVENTQRDINIAYMNELSKVFNALHIDLQEVLQAAGTKWNFLPFHPGLVGGHCIGVDPYYLIHRSEMAGYQPGLLKAARVINNSMGDYVANRFIELIKVKGIQTTDCHVLVAGVSFKPNTADIRNSRVFDVIATLLSHQVKVEVFDPLVDAAQVKAISGVDCINRLQREKNYDGIIIAVAHTLFEGFDFTPFLKTPSVVYDLQGCSANNVADETL